MSEAPSTAIHKAAVHEQIAMHEMREDAELQVLAMKTTLGHLRVRWRFLERRHARGAEPSLLAWSPRPLGQPSQWLLSDAPSHSRTSPTPRF